MKCLSILPILALAALSVVATDKPTHADKPKHDDKRVHADQSDHADKHHPGKPTHPGKSAHNRARPFMASGSGFRADSRMYAPEIKATHLGHKSSLVVSFDQTTLEDFSEFVPDIGAFPPGVLTSANGDELEFYFDEEMYFLEPGTQIFYTTVTFTGGTGRFEDATGSADVMFEFDDSLLFQYFNFLIDGSIDY